MPAVNGDQYGCCAYNSGPVYVFVRTGTSWHQEAYLKAAYPRGSGGVGDGDQFGYSVAIAGNNAIVGAIKESSSATGINGNQRDQSEFGAGAAYVFSRLGTNWTQQSYLKASHVGTNFGVATTVSTDTAIVGGSQATYVFTGIAGESQEWTPHASIVRTQNGFLIRIDGAPHSTVKLQRASKLSGPWSDLGRLTISESGFVEYLDSSPVENSAFYRFLKP